MKASLPLDENQKRQLILQLLRNLQCVECNHLYDPKDFALVQRRQDVWVLRARCPHCGELCQVVVLLTVGAQPEVVTDMTADELQALEEQPAVSTDDVLDIYGFLQHFDGDFEMLFTR